MIFNVVHYEEIDSTNTEARRKSQSGEKEGLVITAEKQSAGKGRRGRNWDSPAGENLYFSILLRPKFAAKAAPMLTLVMAYSAAKAIRALERIDVHIKWPNDLVLSGKKICGILTEMHLTGSEIEDVIVGVGINVNETVFSEELRDKATSLCLEKGESVNRERLFNAILLEFANQYERFLEVENLSYLQEAYNEMLINREREVLVLEPGNEYRAFAQGINSEGELLVKKEDGSVETVFAGEVSVRGIYGYT